MRFDHKAIPTFHPDELVNRSIILAALGLSNYAQSMRAARKMKREKGGRRLLKLPSAKAAYKAAKYSALTSALAAAHGVHGAARALKRSGYDYALNPSVRTKYKAVMFPASLGTMIPLYTSGAGSAMLVALGAELSRKRAEEQGKKYNFNQKYDPTAARVLASWLAYKAPRDAAVLLDLAREHKGTASKKLGRVGVALTKYSRLASTVGPIIASGLLADYALKRVRGKRFKDLSTDEKIGALAPGLAFASLGGNSPMWVRAKSVVRRAARNRGLPLPKRRFYSNDIIGGASAALLGAYGVKKLVDKYRKRKLLNR